MRRAERAAVHLNYVLFMVMSLIWGVTWTATKAGLLAVPPLFFGAMRYVLVSVVLAVMVGNLRVTFGGGRARRVIITACSRSSRPTGSSTGAWFSCRRALPASSTCR